MLRVPGTRRGDDLAHRRARGASVELVYSPMDALDMAAQSPGREFVFLGVGFETTAPGTATAALEARRRGIENFSVFSMLKRVEPALRALIGSEGFAVDAFICPGHVAVITGAEEFAFLPREYGLPAAVAGFEPEDILLAIYHLLDMLARGEPALVNDYPRAVSARGTPSRLRRCTGRSGPGAISGAAWARSRRSGLGLAEELAEFDAERRFGYTHKARGRSEPLPLRRRHNRAHTPEGLPDVRARLHAGRPARALHGLERRGLRGGV